MIRLRVVGNVFWMSIAACFVAGSAVAGSEAGAGVKCLAARSRFWQQLDGICTGASTLRGNLDAMPESERAIATVTLDYCDSKKAPAFAAQALADRQKAIAALAARAAVPSDRIGEALEFVPRAGAALLDRAARRIVSDEALQTGLAGDLAVRELVTNICASDDVRQNLPATCDRPTTGGALLELRRRLIADLAGLPRRMVERAAGPSLEPKWQALRAQLVVAEALLDEAPVASLVSRLGSLAGASLDAMCPSALPDAALVHPDATALELAAAVLQRVLLDGAAWGSRDHYVRVVERVLAERAGHVIRLSAEQTAALDRLLAALGSAEALEKQVRAQAETDVGELARELAHVVEAALRLVAGVPAIATEDVRAFAVALARGELSNAADLAIQVAEHAGVRLPSSALGDAVSIAPRLAVARDEGEARRILRRLVVPLGPWSEHVLFDLNGDVPRIGRNDFNVVGDLMTGYNAQNWGIIGNGALHEYDFSAPDLIAQTSSRDGSLESWVSLDPSPAWRIEIRGTGRAAYYDTTKINTAPGSTQTLADETSWMGRGSLVAGTRYQPGTRFAGGLWLGAGGQYEFYSRLDVGARGARQAASLDQTSTSLLLNGRLRVQYALVPQILAVRLRVDAQRFQITRDSLQMQAVAGVITTTAPAQAATQTEMQTRLFLDADVARFAGFVPSLNTGFDYFMLDSTSDSVASMVPVFGAGIRRDTF